MTTSTDRAAEPAAAITSPWVVLGVVLAGLFTVLFNNAVLVVLLPDLADQFRTSTST